MATGIAGFSVAVDSLSAIKYAKVRTIRDENGIVEDYEIEGDYPKYGNNDDRVDDIAVNLLKTFMKKVKRTKTYRNSKHTTSILTITSNVVYGKKTGTLLTDAALVRHLPQVRTQCTAAIHGALASLSSVAKLPYDYSLDGISNTFSIVPKALGRDDETQQRKPSNYVGWLCSKRWSPLEYQRISTATHCLMHKRIQKNTHN